MRYAWLQGMFENQSASSSAAAASLLYSAVFVNLHTVLIRDSYMPIKGKSSCNAFYVIFGPIIMNTDLIAGSEQEHCEHAHKKQYNLDGYG
jgi:hypothetical protein